MGAIQFIENLDRTNLTISDEDFEKNVEAAVSAITERHKEHVPQSPRHPRVSDKSALSEPEIVPQSSVEVEYATPRRSTSSRRVIDKSVGSDGENTAVGGLLRTIQRPLSSLGRMFSEEPPTQHSGATSPFPLGPQPSPPRLSPAVFQPPRDSNETRRSHEGIRKSEAGRRQTAGLSADQTARQASTETAEAQRLLRVEHNNVVEWVLLNIYLAWADTFRQNSDRNVPGFRQRHHRWCCTWEAGQVCSTLLWPAPRRSLLTTCYPGWVWQ